MMFRGFTCTRFLFLSTLVDTNGEALTGKPGDETTDRTAIRDRWAGWYVTGQHGNQQHLGNILAGPGEDVANLASLRRGNLDALRDLFDTRAYLTEKSDIVALLVFEHQAYIDGWICRRSRFRPHIVLVRMSRSADQLAESPRRRLRELISAISCAVKPSSPAPR
jgi:hypothetical protein